jgi:hypothetical protein
LYAFLGVAVIHLGFVTAGACELDFHRAGWAVAQVAALSGSDSAYGFFAPGVGSQLRATFQVVDKDGATSDELLPTSASREAKLRIADLIALFWTGDEGLRRALAASWAGRILAKHPNAEGVMVHVDAYDLPSMAEYSAGKRPEWAPYYDATFVRKANLVPAPAQEEGDAHETP